MRWPWKREKRAEDPSWAALIDRGAVSASGVYVDAKSAESVSTVHAAVSLIAGTVASLPLHLFNRLQRIYAHRLALSLRQA